MLAETMERPKTQKRRVAAKSRQRRRVDLRALCARITDENRHGEVDVGPAVGHEFGG